MTEKLTYKQAGVDVDQADRTKQLMAKSLEGGPTKDARVISRHGAFASLFEGRFPGVDNPVLVFKAEEPGSKQLLAFQYDRVKGIAFDLINHLINDIVVNGAEPLAVLDTIVCGKLEPEVVVELVENMAQACREHSCTLVGGETSEQPGVIEAGRYILSANVIGVVDKSRIIDGSKIAKGDVVLAMEANGPHTNGYTLIRRLIEKSPSILEKQVGGETFLDAIMKPHRSYLRYLRPVLKDFDVHGLAHITGGGIRDNLRRIMPEGLSAKIDLNSIKILPVFNCIRNCGDVPDQDMLRTFNLGVGMIMVAPEDEAGLICDALQELQCHTYQIGKIVDGKRDVVFDGKLNWKE